MEHSDKGAAAQRTAENAVQNGIISKLRTSPAHGVTGSEEVRSEWDELGCLLSTGSHLADMAADQVKRRISKTLAVSPDVDRDDIGDMTERVYRSISAWAVDDWESRSSCDGDDDEDPGDLNLEILHVRPAVPTGRDEAVAFLQSMLDGSINLLDPELVHRLEPLFKQYADDAAMMDLLNRAAIAYSDAAVTLARKHLASQERRSLQG